MPECSKTIHIFFEESNKSAKKIVDEIYTQFSFSKDDILHSSIGCPVRLYGNLSQVTSYCIDSKTYERDDDFYIFIATSDMGRNVQTYVEAYNKVYDRGCRTMIISLVHNKYFFDANNFTINTYMIKENLTKEDITKLMCIIAQKLIGEKICLFLSYYREEGSVICNEFKNALATTPGFREFMDVKDIEYGTPIQEEIEKNLNNSILICFSTDKYSERFWGTKELLWAKQKNLPIIVVDCLETFEHRRNPNSGNVPVVRINNANFQNFVLETTLLAVKEKLKMQEAKKHFKLDSNVLYLWKAPELYDIKRAEKEKKNTILYPSPPICQCEAEYYSTISDVNLVLDNNLQQQNICQKKICLSFSNTNFNPYVHPLYLENLLNEIIRYAIYGGYQILYGGDWRNKGFTQKILDYYKIYQTKNESHIKFLINYYANFNDTDLNNTYANIRNFGDIIEIAYKDLPCEKQTLEKNDLQAELLSTMRNKMITESDALIVFGGKERSCIGYTSGIAEEVSIAYSLGKPIYLIGSTGGSTSKIIRMIEGAEETFSPSFAGENAHTATININKIIKTINLDHLSDLNGLSINENKQLFYSIDVKEIIRLIFTSLLKTR